VSPDDRAGRGEPVLIAPSVLSCELLGLAEAVGAVEAAGADWLHVDVMDGRFVPPLTFGPMLVEALRQASTLPLDVHLMVEEPERWVEPFITAGASVVTFHVEATRHPRRLCRRIRSLGAMAGIALNPATPPGFLEYVGEDVDLVLVMSVDPGYGGQAFMPETLPKLAEVKRLMTGSGFPSPGEDPRRPGLGGKVLLEVDGGVGPDNAAAVVQAGASVLVAGSSVFGQPDPAAALRALREAAGTAL
jgi:ribulose-phosphate 3-epimerase